jgi:uncharacterized protein YbjT (DUF2867 family)
MARQVLVTGASGFVGSRLAEALEAEGYSVVAMTRHPDTYTGAGKPIFGDVSEPASLRSAMSGVDAAYYLVHSLRRPGPLEQRLRTPVWSVWSISAASAEMGQICPPT